MYNDLKCVFCREENTIDCIEHYLKCIYLSGHRTIATKIQNANYSDLFNDIDSQIRFVKLWIEIENERKSVLETRPEM